MTYSAGISEAIAAMSLAQKVGQIFVFTWRNFAQAQDELRFHPGGFIRISSDALSVARETAAIQSLAGGNLLIAADLERGIGGTISGALEVVTAMALGATDNPQAAYDAGLMIGKEAAAIGINMNYAPVLDVNSNPANPVINTRSFGGTPQLVGRMGVAFARGLNAAGVASCGKHFPGHGDTGFDSHTNLGTLTASRQRLDEIDLAPFREAISAGIDSIMSAHILVPALEPEGLPATLSHRIMTGLLRGELGFTGVISSDALEMGAVANNFPPEQAIPMAINAGCDQVIMPQDPAASVDILLSAVKRGEVTEARINESVARILTLKEKYPSRPRPEDLPRLVSVPEHLDRALEIASDSLTLVHNDGLLPLQPNQKVFCITFNNGGDGRSHFLEPESFPDYLSLTGQSSRHFRAGNLTQTKLINHEIIEQARVAEVIILAAYVNVRLNSGTIDLPAESVEQLQPILQLNKPVILVSFGSPFLIKQFPGVQAYACAYSATQPSQKAMAMAVTGECDFTGKLPIELN